MRERLLHEETLAGWGVGFAGWRLFLDLAETEFKHFGNIYIILCASLDPGGVVLSSETLTFILGDLSLGEVVLGTDDDTRNRAHAAEVDNLVVYDLDHVEGFP